MALLGTLEHGVYVEEEEDECHGMSPSQIHQYFGLADDEISDEEQEQCQAENDGDIGDEESMSDDESCPSGSKDEQMEELDVPDIVCFNIISWVNVYQTILGPFCGAV